MHSTSGIIDWDSLIVDLKSKTGSVRHVDQTIDTDKTNLKTYKEIVDAGLIPYEFARLPFVEMVKNYYDNNLDFTTIGFENYYPDLDQYQPDVHFSKNIVEKFENLINIKVQECWISKVDAHSIVPFHKDEFDKEHIWITVENKTLFRYTVFIDDPIQDQIFIVGNQQFENVSKHRIVKWPSIKELHSLKNNSNKPNFLFHFLGFVHPN